MRLCTGVVCWLGLSVSATVLRLRPRRFAGARRSVAGPSLAGRGPGSLAVPRMRALRRSRSPTRLLDCRSNFGPALAERGPDAADSGASSPSVAYVPSGCPSSCSSSPPSSMGSGMRLGRRAGIALTQTWFRTRSDSLCSRENSGFCKPCQGSLTSAPARQRSAKADLKDSSKPVVGAGGGDSPASPGICGCSWTSRSNLMSCPNRRRSASLTTICSVLRPTGGGNGGLPCLHGSNRKVCFKCGLWKRAPLVEGTLTWYRTPIGSSSMLVLGGCVQSSGGGERLSGNVSSFSLELFLDHTRRSAGGGVDRKSKVRSKLRSKLRSFLCGGLGLMSMGLSIVVVSWSFSVPPNAIDRRPRLSGRPADGASGGRVPRCSGGT
mmetsp:Transcript_41426/g.119284  ORF Transcript_41426/g.119284 Transcript_41426/m.119284 type:complete len:379 (-) Transcript_41426:54-1190(-)